MGLRCAVCGEENPGHAQFCLACGAALPSHTVVRREERKVVSVLFVDLVGSTDLADGADPEDVRARLVPYHTRVRAQIERFGGIVEKFIGDAVMASFGAPIAHEDDAERAVRAGLAALEEIAVLNEQDQRLGLSARAGIETGEALVALEGRADRGETTVMGDVVNTASRLQGVAPTGTLVVGRATYRATREAVEYEPLGPISVKGKAQPLEVWRALSASPAAVRGAAISARAPFVGREHDLAVLVDTFGRTVRECSPQLVTVVGEPGIGKSRLLLELVHAVEGQGATWRRGRCLAYGEGITFWALGEIVKAQAGILESDGSEAAAKLAQALDELVDDASEREWLTSRLGPLVGVEADAAAAPEREELFTAWRGFLEAIATRGPLVVVVEDLHWADPALLAFVEHVADWSVDVPLLLVCTTRPELFERDPSWGGGKRNSTTLTLSPLTDVETLELLSALLGGATIPEHARAELLERAGGNPLYAEEFVRMLSDRGLSGGALEGAWRADTVDVPATVHALISARIDTLPADRKELLHDAAVVGRVFWTGAVAAIGGSDETVVRAAFHEIARKELVRRSRRSSVTGQEEFSFWHAFVRDVAYGQVPRAARARKHIAAARWIETIAGDRVADHAEILAYHYAEARRLAEAAGNTQAAREASLPLVRFLVLAGERAHQLDVEAAIGFLERAADLTSDTQKRGRILIQLADACATGAAWAKGLESATAAVDLLRERDPAGAAAARVSAGIALSYRGDVQAARRQYAHAVRELEGGPPTPELARVCFAIARDHMMAGRSQETIEWSGRTIDAARAAGLEEAANAAKQFRAIARIELGDESALGDLEEAKGQAVELGLGFGGMRAYMNLASQVWLLEGPARALEISRDGIRYGERRGLTTTVNWIRSEMLWPLFDVGPWDELETTADAVIAFDRASGGTYVGVTALTYRAAVDHWRGRAVAAERRTEFLERARTIGDPQLLVTALVVAARISAESGESHEAAGLLREFATATPEKTIWLYRDLAEAARVAARVDALELVEPIASAPFRPPLRGRCALASARATLVEARGRRGEAAQAWAQAVRAWRDYGSLFDLVHALVAEARCLLAASRAGEADARLAEARAIVPRLGSSRLDGEIDVVRASAVTAAERA